MFTPRKSGTRRWPLGTPTRGFLPGLPAGMAMQPASLVRRDTCAQGVYMLKPVGQRRRCPEVCHHSVYAPDGGRAPTLGAGEVGSARVQPADTRAGRCLAVGVRHARQKGAPGPQGPNRLRRAPTSLPAVGATLLLPGHRAWYQGPSRLPTRRSSCQPEARPPGHPTGRPTDYPGHHGRPNQPNSQLSTILII